jgi:hypothetical protein
MSSWKTAEVVAARQLRACLVEFIKQVQLWIHHEEVPNGLFKNSSFTKVSSQKGILDI